MKEETIIITTGERSSCLTENKFGGDPKTDCVSVHVSRPESVTVLEGHTRLYRESDLKAERLAGQYEAWALAQKILELPGEGGYTVEELAKIFGIKNSNPVDMIRTHSFHETVAMVQKWEEKEAQTFRVGDIVKLHWGGEDDCLAVVTWSKPDSDLLSVLLDDGNVDEVFKSRCTKIGKISDAVELLAKLNRLKEVM